MKKLLLLLSILLLFGCAASLQTVKFSTPAFGDIEIMLPVEVPNFTKDQYYALRITDKYCVLVFPQKNGFYKLIINYGKPKIYALIEIQADKTKGWVYIQGYPIPVSLKKIEDMLRGVEAS